MSVRDGLRYLPAATESILRQSMTDLEFLIIDDGSTDGSTEYLASLRDPRVRTIRHDHSIGLTQSLREGVQLARGRYLARMDADDLALPDRLLRQVAFLEARPQVGLVGGDAIVIDSDGARTGILRFARTDLEVRWACAFDNPIAHPAAMLRRSVLTDHGLNYDAQFRTAQDFDLWVRVLRVARGANVAGPVFRYRIHGSSVGGTRRQEQIQTHRSIARRNLSEIVPSVAVDEEMYRQLQLVFRRQPVETEWQSRRAELAELYVQLLKGVLKSAGVRELPSWVYRVESPKLLRLALKPTIASGWEKIVHLAAGPYGGGAWATGCELVNGVTSSVMGRFSKASR